jgi:hydroxylamine reductase
MPVPPIFQYQKDIGIKVVKPMYCYQCEETANAQACMKVGVCGKKSEVAELQDDLIYLLKSIAFYNLKAREHDLNEEGTDRFILDGLFATLTNTNFSKENAEKLLREGFRIRDSIKQKLERANVSLGELPEVAKATPESMKDVDTSFNAPGDEDIRSLRSLLIFGLKGIAAYAHHAYVLGFRDDEIFKFVERALVATTDDSLGADELVGLVMECGSQGVATLALLDKANTTTYGNPEPTQVNIGT